MTTCGGLFKQPYCSLNRLPRFLPSATREKHRRQVILIIGLAQFKTATEDLEVFVADSIEQVTIAAKSQPAWY